MKNLNSLFAGGKDFRKEIESTRRILQYIVA